MTWDHVVSNSQSGGRGSRRVAFVRIVTVISGLRAESVLIPEAISFRPIWKLV